MSMVLLRWCSMSFHNVVCVFAMTIYIFARFHWMSMIYASLFHECLCVILVFRNGFLWFAYDCVYACLYCICFLKRVSMILYDCFHEFVCLCVFVNDFLGFGMTCLCVSRLCVCVGNACLGFVYDLCNAFLWLCMLVSVNVNDLCMICLRGFYDLRILFPCMSMFVFVYTICQWVSMMYGCVVNGCLCVCL